MDKAILTAILIAAVTFILQKTLNNLLYGFIIFISNTLRIGDKISISQGGRELATGHLIKRTPLHIYVKNYERDVFIIPNAVLETCTILNSDYKEGVNYTNYIKITFESNIDKTKEIIKKYVVDNINTNNTEDNTYIILKTEEKGLIVEYNVRSNDVDKSFDTCSDIKEKIITEIQDNEDIELI